MASEFADGRDLRTDVINLPAPAASPARVTLRFGTARLRLGAGASGLREGPC